MDAVELQIYTFLTSAPDIVQRSTAQLMEAVEIQVHTFLKSNLFS